jgi:hypothetical protein
VHAELYEKLQKNGRFPGNRFFMMIGPIIIKKQNAHNLTVKTEVLDRAGMKEIELE